MSRFEFLSFVDTLALNFLAIEVHPRDCVAMVAARNILVVSTEITIFSRGSAACVSARAVTIQTNRQGQYAVFSLISTVGCSHCVSSERYRNRSLKLRNVSAQRPLRYRDSDLRNRRIVAQLLADTAQHSVYSRRERSDVKFGIGIGLQMYV